ncbi:MAG: hypothetical protein MUE77_09715, partial [Sandarakinorhabdus sp.]|nr:hypothetical protein [Sandarakinorhabdus sp.]
WYWTCEANLETRARQDGMPYPLWRDQGYITVVPGAIISKDYVAEQVRQLFAEQDVQFMAFDVAKIGDFLEACERIGLAAWRFKGADERPGQGLMMVPHAQGSKIVFSDKQLSMPTSIEALDDGLRAGTVIIDANPVTTACASNAALKTDATGNRFFDKANSRGRIDGLITVAMVAGAAAMKTPKAKKSVYEKRGVIVL